MLNIHIVTIFPGVCEPYLENSILGRAVDSGFIKIHYYNPLDTVNKLKRVDDRPYGGGPGMVLQAKPFLDCFKKIENFKGNRKSIFFTPSGKLFSQAKAREYSLVDNLVLFCGHYEGIDERVAEITDAEHISIGNFVLTGGEIPALVVIDSVAREISGVLGNEKSLENKRIAGSKVYTRPEKIKYNSQTYSVPKVLLSGNHNEIDKFRKLKEDE